MQIISFKPILISACALFVVSCSSSRFVPEGEYVLDHVKVETDRKELQDLHLVDYVRQRPNSRWFSVLKVPLGFYCLQGSDSTQWWNRFCRKQGEAPSIFQYQRMEASAQDIQRAVMNKGYLHAEVSMDTLLNGRKMDVRFNVKSNERFNVRHFNWVVKDLSVDSLMKVHADECLIREGEPFAMDKLDAERTRITRLLQNNGYHKFNKDFIFFDADTCAGSTDVDLVMSVENYRATTNDSAVNHTIYHVKDVYVYNDLDYAFDEELPGTVNTTHVDGLNLLHENKLPFRKNIYKKMMPVRPGDVCRESDVAEFYNRWSSLGTVKYSTVRMIDHPNDSTLVNCYAMINTLRKRAFTLELEGTNTAGDLGAAAVLGYVNHNLFKGSEMLTLKVRGAYEAIKGLEGYSDQDYMEYSAEASLQFPDMICPFVHRFIKLSYKPKTEFSLLYNSQNRPEFHRRLVSGSWRYRWVSHQQKNQYGLDLLDVNYVFMPWISDTFKKEYLDNTTSRNSILRYNYENLFIIRSGLSYNYNSNRGGSWNNSMNVTSFRFNIEAAGNLLYGLSKMGLTSKSNDDEHYALFNIAYAQYAKMDVDFSRHLPLDKRNALAFRLGLGVAYPYGNATILPYEKRYFSGGANSVRGWSVRELGPGTYKGGNGQIDFINQTGDLKLDLSAELRTFLGWKLHGAIFADAGNIWTLRNYKDQPGGQFNIHRFWKEIAVAYGLGLRFNFDYFVLRFDGGMKAINPAYSEKREHYPLLYPNFKRDFTLHFAVGLPF